MTTQLKRRDPFDMLTPFLGRTWGDWFRGFGDEDAGRLVRPALDISEDDHHYLISAELPGMRKDDVHIKVEDGVLTISGEKRFEDEEKGKNFHRVERRYGAFSRAVTLPNGVNLEQSDATMEDGVLRITIPKSDAAKPKTLTIN